MPLRRVLKGIGMNPKQRISYFPLERMDAEMCKEMQRCQREGTPRPESSAVRAHVPGAFWAFANSWRGIFKKGGWDQPIKEVCPPLVFRPGGGGYCGQPGPSQGPGGGGEGGEVQGP